MGKGTPQADEAGIDPRKLLRYQKTQSLTMAAVGLVALIIGLALGEVGGPWWSLSPVLAIWAMPGVQLWRSASQLDGNLPRLPIRPARSRQPRYLRPLVAVMVVLVIALLATEPQTAVAAICVGVVTYGLLWRVELALGRHQDRQLVVVTRSARYVPWLTYRWGDAEGSQQPA